MYGDAAVGERNIEMIETARMHGLAAKFTGSGGACICLKRPQGEGAAPPPSSGAQGPPKPEAIAVAHPLELSDEEEAELKSVFAAKGFTFVRIAVDVDSSGGGRSPLRALKPIPGAEMRGAVLQID